MPRQLPIGISDFKEMRCPENRTDIYYVDKTPLVHAILLEKKNKALLITRPIRFMKSTNLSMLRYFFDIAHAQENAVLFDDLAIKTNLEYQAIWEQHQGKYPVVYLSFKDAKGENWNILYSQIIKQIQKMYKQHQHIFENSPRLSITDKTRYLAIIHNTVFQLPQVSQYPTSQQQFDEIYTLYCNALAMLIEALHQHYQQRVIVLIDEYDAPLHSAYQHTAPQYRNLTTLEVTALPKEQQDHCYFNKTREWMARFFEAGLKDNDPVLFKAVMTGVLRTAFTSLISSLNNVSIHSILSPEYADYFGITHQELSMILNELEVSHELETVTQQIQRWYNGYEVGCNPNNKRGVLLYNPWSIAKYLARYQKFPDYTEPQAYWLQTGDSSVIGDYGRKFFSQIESELVKLIQKNKIVVRIDERTVFSDLERHNVNAFWGLLLHTGYLTVKDMSFLQEYRFSCTVAIPNQEVSGAYMTFIERWYHDASFAGNINFDQMLNSLLTGQLDYFKHHLEHYILSVVSYFDIPRKARIIPKNAKSLKRKHNDEKQEEGKEQEKEFEEYIEIITPEQMYHLFILGFVAGLHGDCYQVQSNRESGYGRYDLILSPRRPDKHGIIFEFKAAKKPEQLEEYAQAALTQIRTKHYQAALEDHGVKRGLHIGIAFCGKRLHLSSEWCDYKPTAEFHLPISPFSPPIVSTPPLIIPGNFHSSFADDQRENRTIVPGILNGETVQFEIHSTLGDGNCGFYAIPIAGDREAVRRLLLENAGNPQIRALIAPEIQDIVISGHIPNDIPDYLFYTAWRNWYTHLQLITATQEQLNQHIGALRNYTHTQQAFENFVNYDVGGRGRLAYCEFKLN
jgi:hypothetical protein